MALPPRLGAGGQPCPGSGDGMEMRMQCDVVRMGWDEDAVDGMRWGEDMVG